MQFQFTLKSRLRAQKGLTMIEILVTLGIVSVGLLSMASLQLTGVRSVNNSSFRTQASILINDMAERMRANPAALDNNQFLNLNSATLDCNTLPTTYCSSHYAGSQDGVVNAADCNASEMAAYDFNVWFCGESNNGARSDGVIKFLPQAVATVVCNDVDPPGGADSDACTNRSPHTISISWIEMNPQGDVNHPTITQTISMTMQP